MIPIQRKYIAPGHPNRPGTKLTALKAIVIHYTANDSPGADDTMNAEYFGRGWHMGKDGKPAEWQQQQRRNPDGSLMTTPAGTPIYAKAEVPFRYGSAQVICDEDSCCETMPLDEVAWGCGDRHLPYDNLNKGQQPAARIWFGNNQNQMTLNVEICNNANWEKAVTNAHNWIIDQLQQRKLTINISCSLNPNVAGILFPGEVLLLTHHAVTGKNCPAPLVADPAEWERIVRDISARTQA